uniref:Uncharacterized protein n=1 Tax=Arundo donax TaxID=35708 RepID=A0A0A9BC59_ARUDO
MSFTNYLTWSVAKKIYSIYSTVESFQKNPKIGGVICQHGSLIGISVV